jgi:hypothetical protein
MPIARRGIRVQFAVFPNNYTFIAIIFVSSKCEYLCALQSHHGAYFLRIGLFIADHSVYLCSLLHERTDRVHASGGDGHESEDENDEEVYAAGVSLSRWGRRSGVSGLGGLGEWSWEREWERGSHAGACVYVVTRFGRICEESEGCCTVHKMALIS